LIGKYFKAFDLNDSHQSFTIRSKHKNIKEKKKAKVLYEKNLFKENKNLLANTNICYDFVKIINL